MRVSLSMIVAFFVAFIYQSVAAQINSTVTTTHASLSYSRIKSIVYLTITATASSHAAAVHSEVIKPTTGPAPEFGGDMTINITNRHAASLSVALTSNPSAPSASGDPKPAPLGNSTQYLFPTGWNGVIDVAPKLDKAASKIETSYEDSVYADISFVDGYTVPITCSCDNEKVIMGCNVDLFNTTETCTHEGDGPICYNPQAAEVHGPADPFFAPCEGAAYTFPTDDTGTHACKGSLVNCCIGADCLANPAQKDQKLKKVSGRVTGQRD